MPKDDAGWQWFKTKVRDAVGLDLTQYKAEQLDRRLHSMAERAGASNPVEFWKWLNAEPDRMRPFLDRVSINVSELFRNPDKFEQLERLLLPELLERRPSLRVWCAGCANGAEVYSVAALLHEAAPGGRHAIIGTDIDHDALHQAMRARYTEQEMRHVSDLRRRLHFEWDGEHYLPRESLRRYVKFLTHDLLRDHVGKGYDLVLCRNLVIYLNDEAKETVYRRLFQALRPGGVLFMGSTERILNSRELGFESPMPFFYRKPVGGDRQWQCAS